MFHRPKTPPLPNPQLIALPSRLPTTTADLAPDPSPSYHHHVHLVIVITLVSLFQHFCCYHQAYPILLNRRHVCRCKKQRTVKFFSFRQDSSPLKIGQFRELLFLAFKFTWYLQNQSVWFREVCRILAHPSLFTTIARRSPNNNQQQ